MIFIFRLTATNKNGCSFLNVMKIAKSITTLISQSFAAKLCAVAIDG